MKTTINKNAKGYGYTYTDLAEINKYCEDNGISYYQYVDSTITDNQIVDYIVTVLTINGEEQQPRRGVRLVDATLSGIKNPAQEQGSATTYARRYSLLMALGLATEDDDASSLTRKKEVKNQTNYNDKLKQLCKETDLDLVEIAKEYKLNAKTSNERFKEVYLELGGE